MHEKSPTLKVFPRTRLGTRYAARDRAAGLLPGIVYGHKQAPTPVNLASKETLEHIQAGEKVFRLEFEKEGAQLVLLKDLQFDYLGSTVVHADFSRVDLDEKVRTRVHINLTGEAKGLKSAGAILIHPTSEIMIECKVRDLPETINVDVSDLDMNGVITAAQVKLPQADMRLLTDSHSIVAQIVEQKEMVVAEATAVAGEAATSPEVIGEKERAEKAAAEGKAPAAGAKGAAPAAGAKAAAPAAKAAAPKK